MTIQNFEGHGAPGVTIVGEVGDLYTDLDTGKIYQCSMVYRYAASQSLDGVTHEYVWKEKEEGGSGGVSSWNDLTDKPFGYDEYYYGTCLIEAGSYRDGDTIDISLIPGERYYVSIDSDGGNRFVRGVFTAYELRYVPVIDSGTNHAVWKDGDVNFAISDDGTIEISPSNILFDDINIYKITNNEEDERIVRHVPISSEYMPSGYATVQYVEDAIDLLDHTSSSSGAVTILYVINGYLYNDRYGEDACTVNSLNTAFNSSVVYIVDPDEEFGSKMSVAYASLHSTDGVTIKYFDPSSTDTFKLLTATVYE